MTLLYLLIFGVVVALFSVVFYVTLALVLRPAFDLEPDLAHGGASARTAYDATLRVLALALVVADVVVLAAVAVLAWVLAARTMRPLAEAAQRQLRFVRDASHELRGPLAAIMATSEAALLPGAEPDDRRQALELVVDQSRRLGAVSSDLLVLARGDDPSSSADPRPVDLSVVVAEALDRWTEANRQAQGRLTFELAPDAVVAVDPVDLTRIVDNLVDNAFRYGHAETHVMVSTTATGRRCSLVVSDDGPGIAAGDIGRVFEPFFRARADADAPEGTGLGLSIVRGLAHRAGGKVAVSSQPGAGARFEVTFPAAG
ncbi:MAG: HAMP domain-containing sensor histidine kinase [Chloroflexota bacterium]